MSAPDRISICPDFPEYQWNDGETIPPKEWPVYLRLDGPTLQAVREAMTLARRVVASKHEHKLLSDAIKLLEGK